MCKEGANIVHWRERQSYYSNQLLGGLLRYDKRRNSETGRTEVRSLRWRNFEVKLEGSVRDFGKSATKRILNVAGFYEREVEAVQLVLRMTWQHGEQLRDEFSDFVGGMAEGVADHLVNGSGDTVYEDEIRANVEYELRDMAIAEIAAISQESMGFDYVKAAEVMRSWGMGYEEVRDQLEYRFGLNGSSEEVAAQVWAKELA